MADNGDGHGLQDFRATIRGNVYTPADGEPYDKAIRIFNQMYQHRRPAIVVQPRGVSDVVKAVKYAQAHGLPFAVKSGGHGPKGDALADGGMTLDLSQHMRGVVVDAVTETAVVQGGATLGDIDQETGMYNLMVPCGHASITGMGLVLGGGFGVAARKYGVTADHIVVTLRLHDTASFYGGLMIFPFDKFVQVAKFMRDVGQKDPDYCQVLFKDIAVVNTVGSLTYAQTQDALTPMLLAAPPNRQKLIEPTDEFLEKYYQLMLQEPEASNKLSMWVFDLQGGAGLDRKAVWPIANDKLKWSWYGMWCWVDKQDDEEVMSFVNGVADQLAEYSEPAEYINMTVDKYAAPNQVGGEENLARLRELKTRWDPDNFFKLNHNIQPLSSSA
eukprot:jgi/Chlat1/4117/Chrsp26S04126